MVTAPVERSEVRGHRQQIGKSAALTVLRRALAPTFPAGALVFFIPWRVVAENPARRISTCRLTRTRRLVGAAAVGRTMVMSPAAPDFFVVIFRVGADAGARAIGATANEPRGRRRRHPGSKAVLTGDAAACSRSDISGWRAGVLYPLAGGGRESGAAHLDLQTDPHPPPGRCSGGRPHDGDVAGGAGFLCSDIPGRGRRWSAGDRSDRRCGRERATGSTPPTPRIESRVDWCCCGVLSLRHFRLA